MGTQEPGWPSDDVDHTPSPTSAKPTQDSAAQESSVDEPSGEESSAENHSADESATEQSVGEAEKTDEERSPDWPDSAWPEEEPEEITAHSPRIEISSATPAVPMRIEPTGEVHPAEVGGKTVEYPKIEISEPTEIFAIHQDAITQPHKQVPPAVSSSSVGADEPVTETFETTATESTADTNNQKAEQPADSAPEPVSAHEEPVTPPQRRGRRKFVIGALALVVVVALGIALMQPAISNRLGLPWAPNLPKADTPEPTPVAPSLTGPRADAPIPSAAGVKTALDQLAANPVLGTLSGSVIDPGSGATLWNRESSTPLTPASTTKVLTAAAALLTLDHGARLSTKVVQGDEPGSVILIGGGDMTLSSLPVGKESVYPGAAHLDDLVSQVKAAAGGAVRSVQLDLSRYVGPRTAPGWAPEDAPSTFSAPMTPAMLDGGRTNATEGSAQRHANPETVLAQEFAKRLGGAQVRNGTVKAPEDAKVLGEVRSAPLTELVDTFLDASDNDLSEVISREVAIATGAEPSFAGAAKSTVDVLAQHGFDVKSAKLFDNSGLSTMNKVPAKVLSGIISVAAAPADKNPKTALLRPMLEGLPVAGGSGTLSDRYNEPSSEKGKGWVRAKTGSLSGVNTVAGLVLDTDGRVLVFTLMSASNVANAEVRKALDAMTAALRGCGCR